MDLSCETPYSKLRTELLVLHLHRYQLQRTSCSVPLLVPLAAYFALRPEHPCVHGVLVAGKLSSAFNVSLMFRIFTVQVYSI